MREWLTALFNFEHLHAFLVSGGPVLLVLMLTAFVLWSMLIAKLWFKLFEFPALLKHCQGAQTQRSFFIVNAKLSSKLVRSMGLIRTTINVCPLLGLVGTVVGMIEIFDVIAISGANDSQLMAAGVARAILPTMAGMVIAISAMFMFAYIQRWVVKQRILLTRLSLAWEEREHEIKI